MPTIRAVIAEHLGCCTLIGAKTREHTFSVVVVSRQAQRPRRGVAAHCSWCCRARVFGH